MKTQEKIQKFEDVQEPDNFYIMSTNDDLVLKSKEAAELLLKDLENVEYNEKLADFYSNLNNEIIVFTKK
ncbi:MAG: hypothetical protein EU529_05135 [Promethearchaeota archaeon]|nr:MAG: hypothetical protein EU529_05135 [Candidatus Lokiarchaeota archaeon]